MWKGEGSICWIFLDLEAPHPNYSSENDSFIKNVTDSLSEKEFGKESQQYAKCVDLIREKIINSRYISKPVKEW